tara:strand:+ start:589 stop:825 length:237 start_codon:yes stop_codon:yes gene_type:complete
MPGINYNIDPNIIIRKNKFNINIGDLLKCDRSKHIGMCIKVGTYNDDGIDVIIYKIIFGNRNICNRTGHYLTNLYVKQ